VLIQGGNSAGIGKSSIVSTTTRTLTHKDNPTHQFALHSPNICILEYETAHPNLAARHQPSMEYSLAYLCHSATIINEKYDEEITHLYNWPKLTKHFFL
jgi:aspartyl/asparaginyl-tRNA synthetase